MHLGGGLEVRGILQSDLFAKTVECGTAGPCVCAVALPMQSLYET